MCILHLMDEQVDCSTYHYILQLCLINRALPKAKLVHAHIIQSDFKFNCTVKALPNKILSMYAKCGNLIDGDRFLEQMPQQVVISQSIMIAAYSRARHGKEVLTLFNQMQGTCILPNQFTLSILLPTCTDFEAVVEVHEEIIRSGFHSEFFVGNSLLYMYTKYGNAHYVFDKFLR